MALLIVGPGWLGDAVMMGSLIQRLKAQAPARPITVMIPAHLEAIVRRLPGVDATLVNPFAHGDLKLLERRRFGRGLRGQFDEAIVLANSWKSALVPFFARIRRRIGFQGEARNGLLNDARRLDEVALPRMVDRFCLLADPPGTARPRETPEPRLMVPPGEIGGLLARLRLDPARPGVALCVGAEYGPAKRWPAPHFAEVARRLTTAGLQAWLLGGPGDVVVGAEVARLASGAAIDLTGRTTLSEAADLLGAAYAVVTNDSGLMHVAAALGRPIVALYGSSSPAYTPPLSTEAVILSENLPCSPCFQRICPLGHFKCLTDLSPDRVWQALGPWLASPAAPQGLTPAREG